MTRNPNPRSSSRLEVAISATTLLLLLALCLAALSAAAQATDLPVKPKGDIIDVPAKPTAYVNDYAHVLSSAARQQLDALCTEVNDKAKAQIFVVIVPSLGDRTVEDYSFDVATKWGVGPKQTSSGVLIFLAVNDHKYWTQVGYGLEPILPDGKVGGFGREDGPVSPPGKLRRRRDAAHPPHRGCNRARSRRHPQRRAATLPANATAPDTARIPAACSVCCSWA